jgi:hypothetical protein
MVAPRHLNPTHNYIALPGIFNKPCWEDSRDRRTQSNLDHTLPKIAARLYVEAEHTREGRWHDLGIMDATLANPTQRKSDLAQ